MDSDSLISKTRLFLKRYKYHGQGKECRRIYCAAKAGDRTKSGMRHFALQLGHRMAIALIGQKKYDEAEKHLYEAIECSPGLAEAFVALGGISLQRGDLDGCLKHNRSAVKARPGFSEGWGNIGFIELQRGNIEEAIKALEKATTFNFRYVQAFANLANAYLLDGRGSMAELTTVSKPV